MSSVAYHLAELEIVNTPGHTQRSIPRFDCNGWAILDIGCGIGQTLLAAEFSGAAERHGIDVDQLAIDYGTTQHPSLSLRCAPAEAIPHKDASFDLVYSRVSLPYTALHRSIPEMYRVTKPGGLVWMTVHGWDWQMNSLRSLIQRRKFKDIVKRSWVIVNGILFSMTGRTFRRLGSDVMESMQTRGAMKRALARAGFIAISFDGHAITAQRP